MSIKGNESSSARGPIHLGIIDYQWDCSMTLGAECIVVHAVAATGYGWYRAEITWDGVISE